jgi:predicted Zn-dependent protease
MSRLKNRWLAILLSCCLVLSPSGSLWALDDLPELGDVAGGDLSPLAEKKIGRKIMNDIRWHEPMYLDDPEVERYLNQLGNRLAAASPDPSIGFEFFGVNDRMINAFATFGGYVGVNTGLLLNAETESELAGVLAHEVSHITQHHLARQISQGKVASMAVLAAMVVALLAAHSSSSAGMGAAVGAQAGVIQSQLGFSRDFEREADRVGLQNLNKAGFDPSGMSGFFARLQKATRVYENNAPVYLRTHPLNTERIADMQNRESLLPSHQVPDSLEFHLVRAKLRAQLGTPAEAIKYFRELLAAGKTQHAGAAIYGLAVAMSRAKDWVAVDKMLVEARQ